MLNSTRGLVMSLVTITNKLTINGLVSVVSKHWHHRSVYEEVFKGPQRCTQEEAPTITATGALVVSN